MPCRVHRHWWFLDRRKPLVLLRILELHEVRLCTPQDLHAWASSLEHAARQQGFHVRIAWTLRDGSDHSEWNSLVATESTFLKQRVPKRRGRAQQKGEESETEVETEPEAEGSLDRRKKKIRVAERLSHAARQLERQFPAILTAEQMLQVNERAKRYDGRIFEAALRVHCAVTNDCSEERRQQLRNRWDRIVTQMVIEIKRIDRARTSPTLALLVVLYLIDVRWRFQDFDLVELLELRLEDRKYCNCECTTLLALAVAEKMGLFPGVVSLKHGVTTPYHTWIGLPHDPATRHLEPIAYSTKYYHPTSAHFVPVPRRPDDPESELDRPWPDLALLQQWMDTRADDEKCGRADACRTCAFVDRAEGLYGETGTFEEYHTFEDVEELLVRTALKWSDPEQPQMAKQSRVSHEEAAARASRLLPLFQPLEQKVRSVETYQRVLQLSPTTALNQEWLERLHRIVTHDWKEAPSTLLKARQRQAKALWLSLWSYSRPEPARIDERGRPLLLEILSSLQAMDAQWPAGWPSWFAQHLARELKDTESDEQGTAYLQWFVQLGLGEILRLHAFPFWETLLGVLTPAPSAEHGLRRLAELHPLSPQEIYDLIFVADQDQPWVATLSEIWNLRADQRVHQNAKQLVHNAAEHLHVATLRALSFVAEHKDVQESMPSLLSGLARLSFTAVEYDALRHVLLVLAQDYGAASSPLVQRHVPQLLLRDLFARRSRNQDVVVLWLRSLAQHYGVTAPLFPAELPLADLVTIAIRHVWPQVLGELGRREPYVDEKNVPSPAYRAGEDPEIRPHTAVSWVANASRTEASATLLRILASADYTYRVFAYPEVTELVLALVVSAVDSKQVETLIVLQEEGGAAERKEIRDKMPHWIDAAVRANDERLLGVWAENFKAAEYVSITADQVIDWFRAVGTDILVQSRVGRLLVLHWRVHEMPRVQEHVADWLPSNWSHPGAVAGRSFIAYEWGADQFPAVRSRMWTWIRENIQADRPWVAKMLAQTLQADANPDVQRHLPELVRLALERTDSSEVQEWLQVLNEFFGASRNTGVRAYIQENATAILAQHHPKLETLLADEYGALPTSRRLCDSKHSETDVSQIIAYLNSLQHTNAILRYETAQMVLCASQRPHDGARLLRAMREQLKRPEVAYAQTQRVLLRAAQNAIEKAQSLDVLAELLQLRAYGQRLSAAELQVVLATIVARLERNVPFLPGSSPALDETLAMGRQLFTASGGLRLDVFETPHVQFLLYEIMRFHLIGDTDTAVDKMAHLIRERSFATIRKLWSRPRNMETDTWESLQHLPHEVNSTLA